MSSNVIVTGGTGVLGRLVVARLAGRGTRVRSVSRRLPAGEESTASVRYMAADLSLASSVGPVAEAMPGVDAVLHLAGSAQGDDQKTQHLLEAIRAAGAAPHLVSISVVGADRTPVVSALDRMLFGYLAAKRESELKIERSGLPWTTLRATQFHDFGLGLARAVAKLPMAFVPAGTRIQPIDASEVADRLIELADDGPARLVPEMGGPRTYALDELVRSALEVIGRRRPVVGVRLPGRAAAAYRAGTNLSPDHAVGRRTWEEFLAGAATVRR